VFFQNRVKLGIAYKNGFSAYSFIMIES